MVYENSEINVEDKRIRKCVVCECYTNQIVDEYVREYYPWDVTSPTLGHYFREIYLGWRCLTCDDQVDTIRVGLY